MGLTSTVPLTLALMIIAPTSCTRDEPVTPASLGNTTTPAITATPAPPDDVTVFLATTMTDEQAAAIRERVLQLGGVSSVRYVDDKAAYEEFRCLFENQPDLISSVTPDILPASYRLTVVDRSGPVERIRGEVSQLVGVRDVVGSSEVFTRLTGATINRAVACKARGVRLR